MKVLVVGSGGREHVLCWKIARSPLVDKIYCAPGNAGTAKTARNLAIGAGEIGALADFAKNNSVDLTVVGPELPLVEGLADIFNERGLRVFGPSAKAARLEGSKSFTKRLLETHGVPTARAETFDDFEAARAYLAKGDFPVVLKADGLAAGKGVLICENMEQAEAGLTRILVDRAFGSAGEAVLVEEFLRGEEASILALSDGETVLPLASSQDHKRAFDGDRGPNTGGMGAYSPAPVVTPALFDEIMETIMRPVVRGMAEEGAAFQGVLYAGLMIDEGRPKVLEFNVRFGDPEAQPLFMRMKTDIVPLLAACAEGKLHEHRIEWDSRAAACVVMASGGYPGLYSKSRLITGLDADFGEDVEIFHAGTREEEGKTLTAGGRVLGVTALGRGISEAVAGAYKAARKIDFEGAHYRKDIGARAIGKTSGT